MIRFQRGDTVVLRGLHQDGRIERTGHPLFWDEQGAHAIRAEGEQVIAAPAAGAFLRRDIV